MMNTMTFDRADGSQLIAVRDLPDSVTEMIQQQIARLCQEHNYILNCQVSANVPAFCQEGSYQIQIVLTLPDRDLTIERKPIPDYYQEDIYVAIWSAFDLARKKLQEPAAVRADLGTCMTPTQHSSHQQTRTLRRCVGYAQG
jgi:hypothetical protein